MIKQCIGCKHFHSKAVDVPEGNEPVGGWKTTWKCAKGHKIDNPYQTTTCEDFKEKQKLSMI